jgi:hypothetical protein
LLLKKEPVVNCDHGTAAYKEDAHLLKYPFFGVIDGFSESHSSKMPQIFFNGLTGGEIIREIAEKIISSVIPDYDLDKVILAINFCVYKKLKEKGLNITNTGQLPGACFIFAKIEEEKKLVKLIWGGDCLGFWLFKSGETGYTRDIAYAHVEKNLTTIRKLREKGLSIPEMWDIFAPVLAMRRERDINKKALQGFASLNGQPQVAHFWKTVNLPLEKLDTLILSSDGYFQDKEASPKRIPNLAKRMVGEYHTLGFKAMLEKKRMKEETESGETSYIKHDEATAIALEF